MSEPEPNRIKVLLRIRPPNTNESQWFRKGEYGKIHRDENSTPDPDRRVIVDRSSKTYDFDYVFRETATQKSIFRAAAVPTLENVFAGYCGAVLAYGQTGTGKTHTMLGPTSDTGIIPRSAEYIFTRIGKTPDTIFTVRISFVQIYLDKLQDLFRPESPEMTINPEAERVELPGIVEHEVTSTEQFMKLFTAGEKNRVTRATLMNATSSRGHAALVVHIKMEPKYDPEGLIATKLGKLVLVDLAGYERFALTGVTTGIAAEEAKKINASLLALGSCVNALADACTSSRGQYHIPYRNSKLTRLLKDCLGGTSKSTIICTIGPCDKYSQETSGTLYFGWRAMAVKVNATIKETLDPAKYTAFLKEKLNKANDRIRTLVQCLKRASPSAWQAYVAQYGEPDIHIDYDDADQDEEMVLAMSRMESARTLAARAIIEANAKRGGKDKDAPEDLQNMSAQEFLKDVTEGVDNPDAPAEVIAVQKNWNKEIAHQKQQAERELELLRMRHLQDLEEARAAGVDETILTRLREEHDQELLMMREQNVLLKEEIQRQKQKEEAKALLVSAQQANHVATPAVASDNGEVATRAQVEDDHRISEICTHLEETCNNKDDVLVRMFDLICYYEAQIKDYALNAQAIASTHATEMAAGNEKQLQALKKREMQLMQELQASKQDLRQLRTEPGGKFPSGPESMASASVRRQSMDVPPQRTGSFASRPAAPSAQTMKRTNTMPQRVPPTAAASVSRTSSGYTGSSYGSSASYSSYYGASAVRPKR